jgi:hypothetical protein
MASRGVIRFVLHQRTLICPHIAASLPLGQDGEERRNNANQGRFALFRITARSFAWFRMKGKADEYTPVGAGMRKKANKCESMRTGEDSRSLADRRTLSRGFASKARWRAPRGAKPGRQSLGKIDRKVAPEERWTVVQRGINRVAFGVARLAGRSQAKECVGK